mgnify:FL=1
MKTSVYVQNMFHGRMCVCVVPSLPAALTPSQQRKVRALCGLKDCACWSHDIRDEAGNAIAIESYTDDGRWVLGYAYPERVA